MIGDGRTGGADLGGVVEAIGRVRLVPVVTVTDADDAVGLASALVAGGLPVVEITLRTPAAIDAIRKVTTEVPGATVGAGSVTTAAEAAAAIDAGADGLMTIPAAYTALDGGARSAITSREITTDVLRGEMGFEGLVVTDALGMEGVGIGLDADELRGVESLLAGADHVISVRMPGDAESLNVAAAGAVLLHALTSGSADA